MCVISNLLPITQKMLVTMMVKKWNLMLRKKWS